MCNKKRDPTPDTTPAKDTSAKRLSTTKQQDAATHSADTWTLADLHSQNTTSTTNHPSGARTVTDLPSHDIGLIAGIICTCVVLVLVLFIVALLVYRFKQKKRETNESSEMKGRRPLDQTSTPNNSDYATANYEETNADYTTMQDSADLLYTDVVAASSKRHDVKRLPTPQPSDDNQRGEFYASIDHTAGT